MKKIIILLLASVFLASCGAKNEEVIVNTENQISENAVTEVTETDLPAEGKAELETYLKDMEKLLTDEGYDREVIEEALKIKKNEIIESMRASQNTENIPENTTAESPQSIQNGEGTLEKNIYNTEFTEASARIQMEMTDLTANQVIQDSQKFSIFRLGQNNLLSLIADLNASDYSVVSPIFQIFDAQHKTLKITLWSQNPKKVDSILPTFLAMSTSLEKILKEKTSTEIKNAKIAGILEIFVPYADMIYISAEKYADKLDETLRFVNSQLTILNEKFGKNYNAENLKAAISTAKTELELYKTKNNLQ